LRRFERRSREAVEPQMIRPAVKTAGLFLWAGFPLEFTLRPRIARTGVRE
jgi:hypothetical protein